MVTHVVIFSFVDDVADEQVDQLKRALDELGAELAGSVSLRHGADLRLRGGNGDYGLVATFADEAAWAAYQAHPGHKAIVRDLVAPIQAGRTTIQF